MLQLFINSLDIEKRLDHLASPPDASRWLTEHGLITDSARPLTDEDLTHLIDLREGIRAVLVAKHDGDEVPRAEIARLASSLAGSSATIRFSTSGETHIVPPDGLDGVVMKLALIVHEAQLTGHWARFKVCSNDRCRWAFWDSSRNLSGRWCSMAVCGNRAKVRAHRQQRSVTSR